MDHSQANFENSYWRQGSQRAMYRHDQAIRLLSHADGPVLDIGCGDGLFLEMLRAKNIEGVGYDMSEVAIKACTDKGLQAKLMISGKEYLETSAKTVVLLDVLEHVFEPDKMLLNVAETYSQIVVSVPNFASLPSRLQVLLGGVPENNTPRKGHVYWFTHSVLMDLLSKTGWEVVVFTGNVWGGSTPFFGRILRALAQIWPSGLMLSFIIKAKRV